MLCQQILKRCVLPESLGTSSVCMHLPSKHDLIITPIKIIYKDLFKLIVCESQKSNETGW